MIKIFSNISSDIVRFVELCNEKRKKAEEEKKEAERKAREDENFKIYGYRWPNAWMIAHKQDYIDGKYSGYHYESSDYSYGNYGNSYSYGNTSGFCTVYFYEWSSMDGNQKKFFNLKDFYDYCKKCEIVLTEYDKTQLATYSIVYITCKPGHNTILYSGTSYGLQSALESFKVLSNCYK